MSQAPLPTQSLPEAVQRAIQDVALDDRFTLPSGRVYMNGSQALLRLMMLQRQIDELGLSGRVHLLGWIDNDLRTLPQYVAAAAKALEVDIPHNYPVLGGDAFETGTGVHAAAVIKAFKKVAKAYSAMVKAESATRARAPGGSFICP